MDIHLCVYMHMCVYVYRSRYMCMWMCMCVRVCMYVYYEYAQTAWGRWRSIRVLTGRVMSGGWIINLRPRDGGKNGVVWYSAGKSDWAPVAPA